MWGLITHLCVRPVDTLNHLRSGAGGIATAVRMCVVVKNCDHDEVPQGLVVKGGPCVLGRHESSGIAVTMRAARPSLTRKLSPFRHSLAHGVMAEAVVSAAVAALWPPRSPVPQNADEAKARRQQLWHLLRELPAGRSQK